MVGSGSQGDCAMARPNRIQYPGGVCCIVTRGNHGQEIFQDDRDGQCLRRRIEPERAGDGGFSVVAAATNGNVAGVLERTP